MEINLKKKLIGLWSDSAKFFELKGDFDESLKLLEKCEKVIIEEKGKNSKDNSSLLVAKAQILSHQKKNDEAEQLFKEAISCVGEGFNQVAPTKSYALWLKQIGRKEESKIDRKSTRLNSSH